ncbi:MAG: hypothetical protein IKN44_05230 [Bacteroidaceae bacterium]|nr:hypothetical protein [Bacteroidaceae bacterium]
MKKNQSIAWLLGIALTGTVGLASCSSDDAGIDPNVTIDENGVATVKPEFVISLPRSVVNETRMSGDVTQKNGSISQFRGLDNISLIPFGEKPVSSSIKLADIIRLSSISSTGLNRTPTINYKVYANQPVPVGTSNFLFYAKAIDKNADASISTMSEKFTYGILKAKGLANSEFTSPGGITFSLEPINTSTEAQVGDPVGQNIVMLLNNLANISVSGVAAPNDKWSTTEDLKLAQLYNDFVQISVGSSNSLAIMLSRLYASLAFVQSTSVGRPLADAIKAQIEAVCAKTPVSGSPLTLTSAYRGYPTNLGLPDGAVRLLWNADGAPDSFSDVTADYGRGNTVDITDYVYPPALWYYTNTDVKTSDNKESDNYASKGNWGAVINDVYNAENTTVSTSTQSVALVNQVEYGVGRLETTIQLGKEDPNDADKDLTVFYDANGDVINTGSGYTLTGILIGGQSSVGYDFTPKGNEGQTIYDREVVEGIVAKANAIPQATAKANQTLALETRKDQKIYVALELTNGGDEFQGADGIIPAGGTFYMTAVLDPTTAADYGVTRNGITLDRIFIQDHVTNANIIIKNGNADGTGGGLGEATNGVPDLTTPGIEVGTSVNIQWKQGLTLNPEI